MSEEQNSFNKKLGSYMLTANALGSLLTPSEVPKQYQDNLVPESRYEQSMPEYNRGLTIGPYIKPESNQNNSGINFCNTEKNSYSPAFLGGMTKEDQLSEAYQQNFENQKIKSDEEAKKSSMQDPLKNSLDIDPSDPHQREKLPSEKKPENNSQPDNSELAQKLREKPSNSDSSLESKTQEKTKV
jgi:hypothetical protein